MGSSRRRPMKSQPEQVTVEGLRAEIECEEVERGEKRPLQQ